MLLPPIDTFFDINTNPSYISSLLPISIDMKCIQQKYTTNKDDGMKLKNMADTRMKFTDYEDRCLRYLVQHYGTKDWSIISKIIKTKTSRECKDRWEGFLNPKLTNRSWTLDEDMLLARKYGEIGPKWKIISSFFIGRSVSSVRNRWNYLMKDTKMSMYSTSKPQN